MKKLALLLTLCAAGCAHNPDSYHPRVRQLEAAHRSGALDTAQYLRQRIGLDAEHGATHSHKWHGAMLRYSHLEDLHDPMRHGRHYKLIEDARTAGQLTEAQHAELGQLANDAREARSQRQKHRRMERFKMGYR
jgi:hypothetical protein